MISLLPIDPDGVPTGFDGEPPAVATHALGATAGLYRSVGFRMPWVGYLAVEGLTPVGTCGFKSAPVEGRVEIAYFTFPQFQGRGLATDMARALIAIARRDEPAVIVTAQTLPDRNASHRVLEKLGFVVMRTVHHPDDGPVLEWHNVPNSGT